MDVSEYKYTDSDPQASFCMLSKALTAIFKKISFSPQSGRIFELGCGNGSMGHFLLKSGFSMVGVDASASGILQAQKLSPSNTFYQGSVYDNLSLIHGKFSLVLSLEVIEHLYFPRQLVATAFDLLLPGGILVVSTPYHGYFKNLALALTGKMDDHFTALWDHGHIKFWSAKTLKTLLTDGGFEDIEFETAGRIPLLAKSLLAIARKPK